MASPDIAGLGLVLRLDCGCGCSVVGVDAALFAEAWCREALLLSRLGRLSREERWTMVRGRVGGRAAAASSRLSRYNRTRCSDGRGDNRGSRSGSWRRGYESEDSGASQVREARTKELECGHQFPCQSRRRVECSKK